MAVAISILSVVLALSMTTIVALYRIERRFAGEARQEQAVARLAGQFRADAHAALAARLGNDCELDLPGGRTVQYAAAEAEITRVVSQGTEVKHRDSFFLHRGTTVRFSAADKYDGRLLQLHVAAAAKISPGRPSSVRPLTIEAALNVHDRSADEEARP